MSTDQLNTLLDALEGALRVDSSADVGELRRRICDAREERVTAPVTADETDAIVDAAIGKEEAVRLCASVTTGSDNETIRLDGVSDPTTIRRTIKIALAARDLTLKQVARRAAIPYDRAAKVVDGSRPPRPGELARLAGAIKSYDDQGDR
jgi:hypothetical protein